MMDWLMRIGVRRATLAVTLFAILTSVLLSGTGVAIFVGDVPILSWLVVSILAPGIIAPLVVGLVLSLAYELAEARAALAKAALTDPLTGLPNRRYFIEQAEREQALVQRSGTPLSIAMIDIDHFKRINDTFGHASGDSVLIAIAEAGRRTLRRSDLLARHGGEEFVLLLPDTDLAGGMKAAATLHAAIEALLVEDIYPERITASIGVASLPSDGATINEVLAEADRRLYVAKRAGRNRVVGANARPALAHIEPRKAS